MIDVVAGILEKDIEQAIRKIDLAAPHVGAIQIEVTDNTLVPNETITDLSLFADSIAAHPSIPFEAHLMVANPEKYIQAAADAGFTRIIAHIECNDPRRFIELVRFEELEVGLAIDGPTEIREIEPFLEEVDFVLVMMVEAGFAGQPFLPESIEKVKLIHQNFPDLPIEVDGAIKADTAKAAKAVGATRLVSTSFLFKDPAAIAEAVEELQTDIPTEEE
jgi:ribulose-phosphate 3-epimerase